MGVLLSFPSGKKLSDNHEHPVCMLCNQPITDNHGYLIANVLFCPECIKKSKVSLK